MQINLRPKRIYKSGKKERRDRSINNHIRNRIFCDVKKRVCGETSRSVDEGEVGTGKRVLLARSEGCHTQPSAGVEIEGICISSLFIFTQHVYTLLLKCPMWHNRSNQVSERSGLTQARVYTYKYMRSGSFNLLRSVCPIAFSVFRSQ